MRGAGKGLQKMHAHRCSQNPVGRTKVVDTVGAQVFSDQHPLNANVKCVYFIYVARREP